MTVVVGKTHINLGWETLIGLILFSVSTTWAISAYTAAQNSKLDKIMAWQSTHSRIDSVQDVKLDSVFAWHEKAVLERRGLKADVNFLLHNTNVLHTTDGFYTERKINGRILFEKVKTP